MDDLSSGGLHETGKDAVGFQPAIRSSSEGYLAEYNQMSERLFRVIVGGRYAGAPQEGKEKFLFGSCEIGPEGFGGMETKLLFADLVQFRAVKGDGPSRGTSRGTLLNIIKINYLFVFEIMVMRYHATASQIR